MRKLILFLLTIPAWAACTPDARGIVITGLTAIQDNLLGPLVCDGASPWPYFDLAEKGTADNMAPLALGQAPTLSSALSGTVSWTQGDFHITTTANLTAALAGKTWFVGAWNPPGEAAGTGRMLCPIAGVTSTTITCGETILEPSASGVTGYTVTSDANTDNWITENPSVTWNYYDVAIALYRLYYRTGNATYQTQARAYADIHWQWTLDHGYRSTSPRASAMLSQFFRALEGHPERLPGLYNWISVQVPRWRPTFAPDYDPREAGYETWNIALGAKTDSDATRHAQYCSWLTTYIPQWVTAQEADGSFGEKTYGSGGSAVYLSAPKSFTPPFIWLGAPWRATIVAKGLEAAYEVMNDTSAAGCNQTAIAANALTAITNFIVWQRNYGRDSVGRGTAYEVNSASQSQLTVHGAGTASVNVGSTAVVGVGTNWVTAGYCGGAYYIGFEATFTPYRVASCADNTHLTLANAFGLYQSTYGWEPSNISGSLIDFAPQTPSACNSSATWCFDPNDRNLTRVECGAIAWLYAQTLNSTYLAWSDECVSASLGGPTAGLTAATVIGNFVTPAAGPAADGLVTDSVAAAATCGTPPCISAGYPLSNLGKNYGETFGAPGIDNALAWRLWTVILPPGQVVSGARPVSGKGVQ